MRPESRLSIVEVILPSGPGTARSGSSGWAPTESPAGLGVIEALLM
jgi:hypothetical protein